MGECAGTSFSLQLKCEAFGSPDSESVDKAVRVKTPSITLSASFDKCSICSRSAQPQQSILERVGRGQTIAGYHSLLNKGQK